MRRKSGDLSVRDQKRPHLGGISLTPINRELVFYPSIAKVRCQHRIDRGARVLEQMVVENDQ